VFYILGGRLMKYMSFMDVFLSEKKPLTPDKLSRVGARGFKSGPKSVPDQARDMGLEPRGGIAYGPPNSHETTHLNKDGKLVPVEPNDVPTPSTDKKTAPPTVNEPSTPDFGAPSKKIKPSKFKLSSKAPKQSLMTPEEFTIVLDSREEDTMDTFDLLGFDENDPIKKDYKFLYKRLRNIANKKPGKERREALQSLVDTYEISVGRAAVYANVFSNRKGLYKIFSKSSMTSDAIFFLTMCEEEGVTPETATSDQKHLKSHLSGLSKPDFGQPHGMGDSTVASIFNSNDALSDLAGRYKRLFGPIGTDGVMLRSGDENAKSYFEHSVQSNRTIQKLIDEFSGMSSDTNDYSPLIRSLEQYQQNMKYILDNFDVNAFGVYKTMEERVRAVEDTYNRLAIDLHIADPTIASSVMKNLAELNLYDQEIARGLEVYLPADGTFPAGDKIVVSRKETKIERIDTISVKFGKNNSMSHGMPSSTSTICLFHPDPYFRDLFEVRWGKAGYEMGVKGDIIHDQSKFHDFTKLSGMTDAFDYDTLEKIRTCGILLTQRTQAFKRNHKRYQPHTGEIPAPKLEELVDDEQMNVLWNKLHKLLQSGDQQKLQEHLGKSNYHQLMRPGYFSATFFSTMAFDVTLKTSQGLNMVQHNYQEYADNGYVSKTINGSPNISDWALQHFPWGARAGGTTVGLSVTYGDRQ
jgi:hypothetical protein